MNRQHDELARLKARVAALEADAKAARSRAADAERRANEYAAEVARVRDDTLKRVPASMRSRVALMFELQALAAEGGLSDDEAAQLAEVRDALGLSST